MAFNKNEEQERQGYLAWIKHKMRGLPKEEIDEILTEAKECNNLLELTRFMIRHDFIDA